MKFAIITHVSHSDKESKYFGYAPYICEMNIWLKYADEVIVVAPLEKRKSTAIDSFYSHQKIDFKSIPNFCFTSLKNNFKSLFKLPLISWQIFKAMGEADHIHLRCPGNVGLLGCFVQILFPKKIKTAKYAGNWDPKSKQPWSYRLQKWILSNTFLTRNMQVLVYGEWPSQSQNVLPFFTASYSESEKESLLELQVTDPEIRMMFSGTLVEGKNPLYAIQLVQQLQEKGCFVVLDLYGDGKLRVELESYIQKNKLQKVVFLHGNQDKETLKKAYQKSHFVILPSKSEGWPKAIAEGMFWGCVPIATKVSCVPFMLDNGNRGVLLEMNFEKDVAQIESLLLSQKVFFDKSHSARIWSQQYTTDVFETEIKKLLKK